MSSSNISKKVEKSSKKLIFRLTVPINLAALILSKGDQTMTEYSAVSGQWVFTSMGGTLKQLSLFYSKFGLNLSVFEAFIVSIVLAGLGMMFIVFLLKK